MSIFVNRKQKTYEILSDSLMTVLYSSFIISQANARGLYIMLLLCFTIYLINYFNNSNVKGLNIGTFHLYMFVFACFTCLSSLWAIRSDYAIEKSITLIELLLFYSLLYAAYYEADVERLLKIIMCAGFICAIYSLGFYGSEGFRQTIENESRLENEFANVNTIGMACSTAILICIYYFRQEKKYFSLLFIIPALLTIAASGSRKALVILFLGIFYLVLSSKQQTKKKQFLSVLGSFLLLGIIFTIIFKSGLFSTSLNRLDGMIASFTGKGDIDSSSYLRTVFRDIGFDQMRYTPFLGIGMGNARILAYASTRYDCYLHCNYAELGANGGIIGLVLYYWIYVYILAKEYKVLKYNSQASIIFMLVSIQLIMDYGAVSYYSKSTYFLIMVAMLHINKIKKIYKG